jgi:hypothetical protein
MPHLDGKLEEIRKSVNKAIMKNSKRNKDLWFPNQLIVNHKRSEFYDAIIQGTKARLKKYKHREQLRQKFKEQ